MIKAILSHGRPALCLVLALAMLPACGASVPPPSVAPGQPAAAAAPSPSRPAVAVGAATDAEGPPPEPRKHHPGHGMDVMFMESLDSLKLKLTPEQNAVVKSIESDLDELGDALKEPRAKLESDIADGVAAGKLDREKTDADIAALGSAVAATEPSVQDAMNRLHKILDPGQRKKLIATMREKRKALAEYGLGGTTEHGTGRMNERDAKDSDAHEHGGRDGGDGPLSSLGEVLTLTREQTEKLRATPEAEMKANVAARRNRREAAAKQVAAIFAAFEAEPFDAKKAGVGAQGTDTVRAMATQRLQVIETILLVLTPEQRSRFATHLKEHVREIEAGG